MKKILLAVATALALMSFSALNANAQKVYIETPSKLETGLRYKKLKNLYDRDDYRKLDDPAYGTGRAWMNLLLPGLAQFTMGEPGLGVKYLLTSTVIPYTAMAVGYSTAVVGAYADDVEEGSGDVAMIGGLALFVGGSIMSLVSGISSISNAMKVAKVKSLYKHDLEVSNLALQYQFEWSPTVMPVHTASGYTLAPGVGMRLSF